MDDRIRDRRRSVTRQHGRRRGVLVAVALLVVACAALFLWLRSSDVFAVKTITATATERVTKQEISQVTSAVLGSSLLSLSTGDIEEALLALPYVRSVEVYRSFPNTLDVRLVEYDPVARLQAGDGGTWLMAEDGRVLEKITPPRGVNLPLVVPASPVSPEAGKHVAGVLVEAMPVVTLLRSEELDEGFPAVKKVAVSAAGEIVLHLADGAEVRLGDCSRLEQKLTVAAERIQQYLRDQKQVEYVDVSVPDRVAVKAK